MSARARRVEGPDGVEIELDLLPQERELLRTLGAQLSELLRDDDESDDAIARLAPEGYRGDDDAAAEFRHYTRDGLLAGKAGRAELLVAAISPMSSGVLRLPHTEVTAWLTTITDLRLVLAERLGIRRDDDEPHGTLGEVYEWLAALQETLVEALDPDPEGSPPWRST